jgi:hypothetical protein
MFMAYCELCDLDRSVCAHGHADRVKTETARRTDTGAGVPLLWISPARMAHFPGCMHKDDDDFTRWGTLEVPRAWERLANGEELATTGGASVIANSRCSTCIEHGPWE